MSPLPCFFFVWHYFAHSVCLVCSQDLEMILCTLFTFVVTPAHVWNFLQSHGRFYWKTANTANRVYWRENYPGQSAVYYFFPAVSQVTIRTVFAVNRVLEACRDRMQHYQRMDDLLALKLKEGLVPEGLSASYCTVRNNSRHQYFGDGSSKFGQLDDVVPFGDVANLMGSYIRDVGNLDSYVSTAAKY